MVPSEDDGNLTLKAIFVFMKYRDNFIPPLEGTSHLPGELFAVQISILYTRVCYLVVDITIMNFFFAAQQAFLDKAINNSCNFCLARGDLNSLLNLFSG